MANQWLRLYAEFAHDQKIQMMSEAFQRRYIMLLCIRCSNGDVTLQDDEVTFLLRISNEEWQETKAVFLAKNLIDDRNLPTAWDRRQFASDLSAARVARHRERKKEECNTGNVTVTPPEAEAEAEADTEVNPSLSTGASDPAPVVHPTRKGEICGLLRKAGMADAAPHYLPDDVWTAILAKRTNEEIIEVAKAKMAAMPNQRIGLKYIAPALLDDPKPIDAKARASPVIVKSGRQSRVDNYAAQAAAARGDHGNNGSSNERDITGEAYRVA